MHFQKYFERDAYAVFFPLGLFLSLLGVVLWIPYGFHGYNSYPVLPHINYMVGGFLLSFSSGFLMTAVPRFTGSFPPSKFEKYILWGSLLSLVIVGPLARPWLWDLALLVAVTSLGFFVVRRFRAGGAPPAPFYMVLYGLLSAEVAMILALASDLGMVEGYGVGSPVYRSLFLHNFMMTVLLGLGSRLYPAFSGHGPSLGFFKLFGSRATVVEGKIFHAVGLILFLGSFFLNQIQIVRPLVILFFFLSFWKIYQLPPNRSRMSYGMLIAAWLYALGYVAAAFDSTHAVHWYHLSFVSGLGLMTLSLGSRVVLGHGGHGLSYESSSKFYYWIVGLLVLAATTRLTGGLIPKVYDTHLAYAAVLWVVGMGLWGWFFWKKN